MMGNTLISPSLVTCLEWLEEQGKERCAGKCPQVRGIICASWQPVNRWMAKATSSLDVLVSLNFPSLSHCPFEGSLWYMNFSMHCKYRQINLPRSRMKPSTFAALTPFLCPCICSEIWWGRNWALYFSCWFLRGFLLFFLKLNSQQVEGRSR